MKKLFAFPILAGSLLVSCAWAQDFPLKPLRFVVPFTNGTGMDTIARLIGPRFSEKFGQPVVVENRLGVSGHLGAQMVAKSPADGHTLVVTARNISITASLYASPEFDAMKDLTPVIIAGWGTTTLVTGGKSKFNTLGELIASAKANPGKLNFASAGVGSPSHFALESFMQATSTQFLHVPYKGTAPVVTALLSGEVDVALLASHTLVPQVTQGILKTIAAASQTRNRSFPNLQSFGEQGVKNFSDEGWYGFLAPTGTPKNIIQKLNNEFRAILLQPDVKAPLEKIGLEVRPSTPEEMGQQILKEFTTFAEIIKKNNIKGE
ncbi:MAG: Bug family tripartite tricarboxylate transporter substrate binding protein [Burkholderiales bacterium]